MIKKFMGLHIILRIILLLPVISWITEMVIRWGDFIEHKDTGALIVAIIVTLTGYITGLIDLILMLITGKLFRLVLK